MILAPEGSSSRTLRIPAAQERDAGVYTCRAVNEIGDASAEIRLEVGHAPQLMELPRDVTVELGRSALLPLGPGRGSRTRQPDSGVLFFESVVPEDQALYVCEAQNVFGKVRAEARLVVTGHVPPQIASSASTVRVLERQPVSLPCILLAGRPFPERRWLKAGLPLPAGSRHSVRADGSLHLDQALQEDAGKYSCVVTNTAGSQHRAVELVVQVPPRIQPTATHHVTNEGVPASLPCAASGVPTPTITWTKETNVLTSRGPHYNVSKDGTLVITRPSPQDAGTYVCTATNAVGFSSQEMRLSVNTEPRIQVNSSRDADEPLRVTAKAGDEVTLDCEAQGSPAPLVTWTKDFRPVPSVTDRHRLLPSGSLRLAQAQVGDSGPYRCIASNPAGSASRRYVLQVQGRPVLVAWVSPMALSFPLCFLGLLHALPLLQAGLCHLFMGALQCLLPSPLHPTSLQSLCLSSFPFSLPPYLWLGCPENRGQGPGQCQAQCLECGSPGTCGQEPGCCLAGDLGHIISPLLAPVKQEWGGDFHDSSESPGVFPGRFCAWSSSRG
uniref:Ig-like domain-containing protein n=1 Tax=Ursus maritimus TaxID=29073 RepID=A0A452UY51_URSMA